MSQFSRRRHVFVLHILDACVDALCAPNKIFFNKFTFVVEMNDFLDVGSHQEYHLILSVAKSPFATYTHNKTLILNIQTLAR